MSTKAIREALALLRKHVDACGPCEHEVNICVCGDLRAHADALAELETIEKAAKTLDRLEVGNFTYNILHGGRVLSETPAGENAWDHPDVKAWSDAAQLMKSIAEESK